MTLPRLKPNAKRTIPQRILLWLSEKTHDTKESLITLLIFIITGSAVAILFLLLNQFYQFDIMSWIQTMPYLYPFAQTLIAEIKAKSILGLYYLFSFSSLFFIPTPLELLYYGFLKSNTTSITIIVILGIATGQTINYVLGRMFSSFLRSFIKKKTRRSIAQKVQSYGSYAIFIMNAIIFPYPVANMLFGAFRYPFYKWFPAMLLAHTIKFTAIFLAYTYFF